MSGVNTTIGAHLESAYPQAASPSPSTKPEPQPQIAIRPLDAFMQFDEICEGKSRLCASTEGIALSRFYPGLARLVRDNRLYFPDTRPGSPTQDIVLLELEGGFDLGYDPRLVGPYGMQVPFSHVWREIRNNWLAAMLPTIALDGVLRLHEGRLYFEWKKPLLLGEDAMDIRIDIAERLKRLSDPTLYNTLFDADGYLRTDGIPLDAFKGKSDGRMQVFASGNLEFEITAQAFFDNLVTVDLVKGLVEALTPRGEGELRVKAALDLKKGVIHTLDIRTSPNFLSLPYADAAGEFQDRFVSNPSLGINGWQVEHWSPNLPDNFHESIIAGNCLRDDRKNKDRMSEGDMGKERDCARVSVPVYYENPEGRSAQMLEFEGGVRKIFGIERKSEKEGAEKSEEESAIILGKPRDATYHKGERWAFWDEWWLGAGILSEIWPTVTVQGTDIFVQHGTNNLPLSLQAFQRESEAAVEQRRNETQSAERTKGERPLTRPLLKLDRIEEIPAIIPSEEPADPPIMATIDRLRETPIQDERLSSIAENNFYFGTGPLTGPVRAVVRSLLSKELILSRLDVDFVTKVAQGEAMHPSEMPVSDEGWNAIFEFMKARKILADNYYDHLREMPKPLAAYADLDEYGGKEGIRAQYRAALEQLEQEFETRYGRSFRGVRVPGPWTFPNDPETGKEGGAYLLAYTDVNGNINQSVSLFTRHPDPVNGDPEMGMEATYDGFLNPVLRNGDRFDSTISLISSMVAIGGWQVVDPDRILEYRKQHPDVEIDEEDLIGRLISCPAIRNGCIGQIESPERDITMDTILSWGMQDALEALGLPVGPDSRFPLRLTSGLLPVALMIEKLANLNYPFFDVEGSQITGSMDLKGTIHLGKLTPEGEALSIAFPELATLAIATDSSQRNRLAGGLTVPHNTMSGQVPELIIQLGQQFKMHLKDTHLQFKYEHDQLTIAVQRTVDGQGATGQIEYGDHHFDFDDASFEFNLDLHVDADGAYSNNRYGITNLKVKRFEYTNPKTGVSIPIEPNDLSDLALTFSGLQGEGFSLKGRDIKLPFYGIKIAVTQKEWWVRQKLQEFTLTTKPGEEIELVVGKNKIQVNPNNGKRLPIDLYVKDRLQLVYRLHFPPHEDGKEKSDQTPESLDQTIDLEVSHHSKIGSLTLTKSKTDWEPDEINFGRSEFEIKEGDIQLGAVVPLWGALFTDVFTIRHPHDWEESALVRFSDFKMQEGYYVLHGADIEILGDATKTCSGNDCAGNMSDLHLGELLLDLRNGTPEFFVRDAEGPVSLGEYTRGWELSVYLEGQD